MNKGKNIIKWLLVGLCFLCGVGAMPSIGAILLFLLGAALIPLKNMTSFIDGLFHKIPNYKSWMKYAIFTLLFFIGIGLAPHNETASVPDSLEASTEFETETTEELSEMIMDTETVEEKYLDTSKEILVEEENKSTKNDIQSNGKDDFSGSDVSDASTMGSFDRSSIPEYTGKAYVSINNNIPFFSDNEMSNASYENYGNLDTLGRCTVCVASVGQDIMPTAERGKIGSVKPTGWHTVKYDFVDGKYLYNRCHLIGYQLTGENANIKNLITGTRYLNIEGMLPFENMVADYVKETNNHVMYRVTPIFDGDNLLATGVLMEGKSVEDRGEGILFCVFAYNVQPGVTIDYMTGDSVADGTIAKQSSDETKNSSTNNSVSDEKKSGNMAESKTDMASQQSQTDQAATAEQPETVEQTPQATDATYILNTNTHKFHYPGCSSVKRIKAENYSEFTGSREELINQGYDPCGNCNP